MKYSISTILLISLISTNFAVTTQGKQTNVNTQIVTGKTLIESIYKTLKINTSGMTIINKAQIDRIIPKGLDINKPIKRADTAQVLNNIITMYPTVKNKIIPTKVEVKSGREVDLWRYKKEWWDKQSDSEKRKILNYDIDMQSFQMLTFTYKDGHKVVKYSWNPIRNGREFGSYYTNTKNKLVIPSIDNEMYSMMIKQGRMLPEDKIRFRQLYKDYNLIPQARREAVERIADLGIMNGYFTYTKEKVLPYQLSFWLTSTETSYDAEYDKTKNTTYFKPNDILKPNEFKDIQNRLLNEKLRICDDEMVSKKIDSELGVKTFYTDYPVFRCFDVKTIYHLKNLQNLNDGKPLIISTVMDDNYIGEVFMYKNLNRSYLIPYPLP
jgi:hypothetical protein